MQAQPTAVVAQPNVAAIPSGMFRDDVFGCFGDCNSCLLACCCPCISFANIQSQIQGNTIVIGRQEWAANCCVYFLGAALGGVGAGVLTMIITTGLVGFQRKEFRQTYDIPGDDLQDFFCACCCQCCVLAQMDRHLGTSQSGCVFSDPGTVPGLPVRVIATQPHSVVGGMPQPQPGMAVAQPVAQPGMAIAQPVAQPGMAMAQPVVVAAQVPAKNEDGGSV